jgi:glucokinase
MASIGVDIGGSGVRAARVVDGEVGEIVSRKLVDRDVTTVVRTVAEVVDALGGADRVGAGMPGFVDDGVVRASPNFPTWRDVDLRSALVEEMSVPVQVENDANCATWGAWISRGRCEELVLLTLGTGVGGGIVSKGRLVTGARGTGAELGHIWVGGDQPCGCGGVGCLEQHAGTAGLKARAASRGHLVNDGLEIVEKARAGEPWAQRLMEEAALGLGRAFVIYSNLFNPDSIVLVGGLAGAQDLLEPTAMAHLKRYGVAASAEHVQVHWGGRADALAILGAAQLSRSSQG